MPKIRDLGISGILNRATDTTCSDTCPDNTAQCEPGSCAEGSRRSRVDAGALTNDAVMQLKQQLQNYMR